MKLRLSPLTHFYLMRFVALLTLFTGCTYLGWKTYMVATRVRDAGPACILFLFTELIVFVCSLMIVLELSVPAGERPALTVPAGGPYPTVAMFVCCCNEALDIIQDTVRGALAQEYPPEQYTVYVLDDGGDDALKAWVEAEAAERGGSGRLRYVRRPKPPGVPHHYKAGNINWGLTVAGGDFVCIFDADMIPDRFYLPSMLPHFSDERIAFVQCPQAFYNVVRGDPLNDASLDFYDVFLPLRDGRDSAQCVGTGVMIRASCLRENGGFTTGSITEDFDTAMSFHARGYKTVYINQRLQAGITPWTLEGYIKQHQRWCTGSLQILFYRNPLLLMDRRFSLVRRISYWYAGAQYYMNVVVMMILVLPILILAFDFRIFVRGAPFATERLYIILLVPYVLASRLLCYTLFCRLPCSMRVQMRGEQVWYWNAWFNCLAILRFMFPFVASRFDATGSTKKRQLTVWDRLLTLAFHILYVACGLSVIAYKFATLKFTDCGRLLKVTAWSPFILFSCQCMLVPILHVINGHKHPRPEDRRKMLSYDKAGVPLLRQEQLFPEDDARIWLFQIVPALWGATIVFYFVAAVTDWSPPFCKESTFFSFEHF